MSTEYADWLRQINDLLEDSSDDDESVVEISTSSSFSELDLDWLETTEPKKKRPKVSKTATPPELSLDTTNPEPSMLEHLVCSISLEVPVDPVMADDGYTYERSFMEEYMESCKGGLVFSPITRKLITATLKPNVQAKILIEAMVEKAPPNDELANSWKERSKQQKENQKTLLQKAAGGHVDSMMLLGNKYRMGSSGYHRDPAKAYEWFKRAADNGSYSGMARAATYLLLEKPNATAADKAQGISFMSLAAHEGGSSHACICLGTWYARGLPGVVRIDRVQARRLLALGLSGYCDEDDISTYSNGYRDACRILESLSSVAAAKGHA
jgi:hypothetical protein